MTARAGLLLLAAGVLAGHAAAWAQRLERLDDSRSPRQRVTAEVQWLERGHVFGLSDEQLNALLATVAGLEVRLDTSAYLGKQARIYMRLPRDVRGQDGSGDLLMSWQTRGVFQNGQAVPEQRALIFEGMITEPQMGDVLDLHIRYDARSVSGPLNLDLIYEIEIL